MLRALIAAGDAATVTLLAEDLHQHPNTVREHLDALVAGGRADRLRSQPVGRGRPAWLYQAVGPADAGDADRMGGGQFGNVGHEYASLAIALIDQVASTSPDPRSLARQAGERWGRALVDQRADSRTSPQTDTSSRNDTSSQNDTATPEQQRTHRGRKPARSPADDPSTVVVDLLTDLRFEPQPATTPHTMRLTTCPLLDAARRNPDVVCEVHLGIVRGALDRLGSDPAGADLLAFAEPGACLLTLPGRP